MKAPSVIGLGRQQKYVVRCLSRPACIRVDYQMFPRGFRRDCGTELVAAHSARLVYQSILPGVWRKEEFAPVEPHIVRRLYERGLLVTEDGAEVPKRCLDTATHKTYNLFLREGIEVDEDGHIDWRPHGACA